VGLDEARDALNSRKPLILVVAALLAAVAVFVLYQYVNSLKDKAYGNAQKVTVYVVQNPVPKGTYGQETKGLIVQSEIPRQFYPNNAITSMDQITNKVAVADLSKNQIIVNGNFVDPSTSTFSLSSQLKQIRGTDQVAITIQVDQVRGVAGLIVPGDYVNIMATKVQDVSPTGGGGGGGAAGSSCGSTPLPAGVSSDDVLFCQQARYVYQKAEVLAVGSSSIPQPGQTGSGTGDTTPTTQGTQNAGLITLIVPALPAQYIASLPPANIYLELVAKDYKPVKMKAIKPFDPLPAEDPTKLTPYGPQGPA
jgi:Flp pilus assembly protein CpaB